jgi:hypothetical protein
MLAGVDLAVTLVVVLGVGMLAVIRFTEGNIPAKPAKLAAIHIAQQRKLSVHSSSNP